MHGAATAARRIGQGQSLNHDQLGRVARIHTAIFLFYAVDGLLLTGLAVLGTVPLRFGLVYAITGWCAAGLTVLAFWRGRKRVRELEINDFAMSFCAAMQMLATALLAPSVGGMMMMSMMTVFAATALQVRTRPLLWLWATLSVATAATMLASTDGLELPMSTPAHRLLCAAWFAWLLGKCGLTSVEGTRLRQQVGDANSRLVQALAELRKIATTDELTVISNRRSIVSDLDTAIAAAGRGDGLVAVALFDLDHFKLVNDRFGHATGDAVLREFASLVSRGLRPIDTVGRYGGEEFLLVLQQVGSAAVAREAAERMRKAVESFDWGAVIAGLSVTASVGVALIGRGESAAGAIARADGALYAAKAGGRNRVVLAEAGASLGILAPRPVAP